MNIEETRIVEFLTIRPNLFVSSMEISKHLDRKKFELDRNWARPLLRRMELDEILESNNFGEYRLKRGEAETTTFKKALSLPGATLGDTTIIALDAQKDSDTAQAASG